MKKLIFTLITTGIVGWIVFKALIFASAINQALDHALQVSQGK